MKSLLLKANPNPILCNSLMKPQALVLKKTQVVICMSSRSKNRRPLQRGRDLSIEAIQTVQALKRASSQNPSISLDQVLQSKFSRLLKFDMLAVLRELLRQNECFLALKVFEDVRKECWYKPRVSLYADIIGVLASNGLFQEVEFVFTCMKTESNLDPEIEAFESLLRTLMSYNLVELVMDCYDLMKAIDCEPDRSSFRILINGLESMGETVLSAIVRHDAQNYYGESLEFLNEEQETILSPYESNKMH
ncbi:hypothetical protein CFOL_v3_25274 [Cephalotus follicularis]|uniref:PPR domain-containing protein n=1 Tax=Cephalotus follicularis TaxID=3775 RepID=A0A1Q3CNY8_CEPFO|nr:hypothetical protein CFOL_v3_25274 [Cephalotus follicularis]